MSLPREVVAWCQRQGHGEIQSQQPVAGGCINNGTRLRTRNGTSFFLKQNSSAPEGMFAREAEGLQILARAEGPRVPAPFLFGGDFLLLEDLRPARRRAGYWEVFGRQLAEMHETMGDAFGFDHDNYLGSTPQPNPPTEDGYQFFADHRLRFQADLAHKAGLLDGEDAERVHRLAARLPELVPEQPPSLLHGDLWSGNALTGPDGEPAIIDPAAHYGWAEAELGMTALFGGFPESFYHAYATQRSLDSGWRDRLPLYNLYHLLNHLNLFGRSYLGRVQSVLRRFS